MVLERFWEKLIDKIENIDKGKIRQYIGELLWERGLLENIFNSLTEGILVLDFDNNPVYINKRLNEIISIDVNDLFDSFSFYDKRLAHLILESKAEFKDEVVEVMEPRHRLLNVSKLALLSKEGKPLGAIVIIDDITQERKAQEERASGERFATLSQLAAGVAHEVGNPLNALQIHLELLKKGVDKLPSKSRGKLMGSVKIIREEISRLDKIVNQFLEASRPSLLKLEETTIEGTLKELVAFLSPEFTRNNIRIRESYSPHIPSFLFDRQQIKQALLNIFKNSIEAMPKGGSIYVSTFLRGDRIEITIKDEGFGVAEHNLYRIFEPYFTTKKNGSGLGLMITYRIIKAHGGDIKFKSKVGEGTEITVILPLKRTHVPLPAHFKKTFFPKDFVKFPSTKRKKRN
ncbi:MAG: ATP-binding protein [Candidatus Ratteibacteria bacterium]|nr:ATP-binding protein [Candidatus Ratteibacteria bacterium]